MSLSHAILGILTINPMSGYDLKHQIFDQSIAHFWQADQAQIYRTLDKMQADGWVTSETTIQDDRPNKKVYSITDAGMVELRAWLMTPQPLPVRREAYLIQLFLSGMLPNAAVLEQIRQQIDAHQQLVERYDSIPLPQLGSQGITRDQTLWRLTLELGYALEKTYLDWLAHCREVVTGLTEPPAHEDDAPSS